ncbi:MAG: rhodanese-like domain-containing protein [Spirosomaceae bacterium]|jgi:rhodanese-related sulfurtransferase|nr:rhodanese-like domain-containing protein [Spirosomataceae bacterium]
MKSWTLIFFMMLWFGKANAQARVESGAYNTLLKTLLSHSVPEIGVKEAVIAQAVFVDAREQREYEVSHLQNALWVGYDRLDLTPLQKLPKNQPIVVYCSVGYRSEKVTEKLIKQGFTNVKNLYGGIFEWKNQGQAVVNAQGTTEQVHAYSKTWGVWLKKGKKVYE